MIHAPDATHAPQVETGAQGSPQHVQPAAADAGASESPDLPSPIDAARHERPCPAACAAAALPVGSDRQSQQHTDTGFMAVRRARDLDGM